MIQGEPESNKKILDQLANQPLDNREELGQQPSSEQEKEGFIFIPFASFWKGKVKGMGEPQSEKEPVPFFMRLWIRYENWKDKLWKTNSSTQTFVNEGNSSITGLFTKTGKKNSIHLQGMQSPIQMNLGQYVHELLFEHNCVIVPELGGFISRRVTAQLNPVAHRISPPGKKIAFNQGLHVNDGLLAQTIAKEEEITYEAALQHIATQVVALRQQLYSEKTVTLDKIGHFVIDQNEVLTFHPEVENNFDKQTYGLVTIQAIPLIRHENDKLKRKIKARIENRRPVNQSQRTTGRTTVGRVLANVAIILIVAVFSLASVMVSTNQSASMFSFDFEQMFGSEESANNNSVKNSLDTKTIEQLNHLGFDRKGEYMILLRSFDQVATASEFAQTLNDEGVSTAKACYKEDGKTWVAVSRNNQMEESKKVLETLVRNYPQAKIIEK